MDILSALEYKKGHYSVTALRFEKVTWSGVTILDWELSNYTDLFYLWNRDDMSDFDDFKLDLEGFKAPDWNACCRRYGWQAIQEITLWASASRLWFYTGQFDFSTISNPDPKIVLDLSNLVWKKADK